MKNLFFALCLSAGVASLATAQRSDTIRVPMKTSFGIRDLIVRSTFPVKTLTMAGSTGYPACRESRMGGSIINGDQYDFDEYKQGRKTYAELLQHLRGSIADTAALSPSPLRTYVKVFSGLRDGKKVVIVDANNNDSFADETLYEFDTLTTDKRYRNDTLEQAPLVRVKYEAFVRGKTVEKYTYLRVKPYDYAYGYPKYIDKQLAVYTINSTSKLGTFIVANQEYKVNAGLHLSANVERFGSNYYYKIQKRGVDYQEIVYEQGKKPQLVDGHSFQAIAFTPNGDTLTLVYGGYQANPVGGYLNFKLPKLVGNDHEGKAIDIAQQLNDNRYVLLDFWGTWCAPCLRSMPFVKTLYSTLDLTKVRLYGVDYEYTDAAREEAKKMMLAQGIVWPQIAEAPPSKHKGFKLAEELDVKNYPTLMLLSPQGTVVARYTDEVEMKKIVGTLGELGLLKK